jgi:AcrR family transcriptional regulator
MQLRQIPPPTPRRAQQRSLTGRQAELMAELERIFLEEGFAHLTLDALASRLRCAKITLYSLAPSREQLTLTVLRRFFDEAGRRIEIRLQPINDPHEQIRVCLAGELAELKHMSPLCFEDILHYGPTSDLYQAFSATTAERLADAITNSVTPNVLDSRHVAFAAHAARRVLDTVYSGTAIEPYQLTNEEAVTLLIHMMTALTTNPPPPHRNRVRRVK